MTGKVLQPPYHRPVYLWAGPGTVRMNRLKFMGARVDEEVHREAHRGDGGGSPQPTRPRSAGPT